MLLPLLGMSGGGQEAKLCHCTLIYVSLNIQEGMHVHVYLRSQITHLTAIVGNFMHVAVIHNIPLFT